MKIFFEIKFNRENEQKSYLHIKQEYLSRENLNMNLFVMIKFHFKILKNKY